MYSLHFQADDGPNMLTGFHGYPLAHRYGKVHLIYFQISVQPLVHTVVHPCHVNTGIHTDQHNIVQDLPNDKSLQAFERYALRTEGKYNLVQLKAF